jgi:hypothetical protein
MAMIGRAVKAWGLSVLVCVALLFVWTLFQQALVGRWDSAGRHALDVALAFGSVFAVVAVTLHLPIFLILTIMTPQRITRTAAALMGGALAPVVYLALAMAFKESDGPRTALESLQALMRDPVGFLAGAAPFALAGAVFGLAWVCPRHGVHDHRIKGADVIAP